MAGVFSRRRTRRMAPSFSSRCQPTEGNPQRRGSRHPLRILLVIAEKPPPFTSLPFLLGLGLTITVVKAVAVDLSPGAATRDGFKAIGLACLKQMIGNNPALLAGDPEGVHQMRVGLRRLRAARFGSPSGGGHCLQQPGGARGKGGDHDHSNRLRNGRRSDPTRPRREP